MVPLPAESRRIVAGPKYLCTAGFQVYTAMQRGDQFESSGGLTQRFRRGGDIAHSFSPGKSSGG